MNDLDIKIREMAALGLPIVPTAVGGVPDLLEHEETSLLVPDGDYKTMADSIQRLLEDPALTRRLSENGRELVESCSGEPVMP